ncbi:MAG: AbrB/MazE/SpoVT family DNA-binding domain-containing protein [Solirubrobacterales bacterium]|nr:AbrB/MazE/SpoVT family DNA-binding domain-containing protein [Solirubrobacterales bacterium]
MAAIRVGKQGRIVLPAGIRRQLGIREGDRLGVIVDARGRVVMESPEAALNEVRQKLRRARGDRSLVDEYLAEKRIEVENEERDVGRRPGSS